MKKTICIEDIDIFGVLEAIGMDAAAEDEEDISNTMSAK